MAYGAKGERNGLHQAGKRQHAWWATDADWDSLKRVASEFGRNVTQLMTAIARGAIRVYETEMVCTDLKKPRDIDQIEKLKEA